MRHGDDPTRLCPIQPSLPDPPLPHSFSNPPNLEMNEQDDVTPDSTDDEDEPPDLVSSESEDDEDEPFPDRDEQGNEPAALVPEGHDLEYMLDEQMPHSPAPPPAQTSTRLGQEEREEEGQGALEGVDGEEAPPDPQVQ
jgi:hypothetical protein